MHTVQLTHTYTGSCLSCESHSRMISYDMHQCMGRQHRITATRIVTKTYISCKGCIWLHRVTAQQRISTGTRPCSANSQAQNIGGGPSCRESTSNHSQQRNLELKHCIKALCNDLHMTLAQESHGLSVQGLALHGPHLQAWGNSRLFRSMRAAWVVCRHRLGTLRVHLSTVMWPCRGTDPH